MEVDLPQVDDPLGEALHFLRMSGTFYCRSQFRAPWSLIVPPIEHCLMLHVLTAGQCLLQVDGEDERVLGPGDLVLVPQGRGHRLSSDSSAPGSMLFDLEREQVSERYELLELGGDGDRTTMICGLFQFEDPAAERLILQLPPVITVKTWAPAQAEWVRSTLAMIAAEARDMLPGGETVITRLADILVIHAIRSWLRDQRDSRTGWVAALHDRQLGRVIARIHRKPERAWTLEALAEEASMSRSAFAARFTELVGEPPMRYVTRCRMSTALGQLRAQDRTVGQIANELGYESEAAFTRAFRRYTGMSPGAAKRSRIA